jgi:hypothetical protein
MRFLIFIFSFILFNPCANAFVVKKYEKTPKSMSTISNIVSRYNQKKVMKNLRDFVSCCRPSRLPGTDGHKKSADWIVSKIKQIDTSGESVLSIEEFDPDIDYAIEFYNNDFQTKVASRYQANSPEYKKWKGFTDSVLTTLKSFKGLKGKNIIWEKKGLLTPDEVIVIGAHYDTIVYNSKTFQVDPRADMPGADDNGTGVATLLSMIEILSELNLAKTVRIIFFDFQELAFLGSRAYVEKNQADLKKNMAAYLNVEMLGNDTKLFDKTKKLRNYKAYIRKTNDIGHAKDKKIAETIIQGGKQGGSAMKWDIMANSYDNSDHSNFWRKGLTAVAFTQDLENDYNSEKHHTSNDFAETVNQKSFYYAFRSLTSGVLGWNYDLIR